ITGEVEKHIAEGRRSEGRRHDSQPPMLLEKAKECRIEKELNQELFEIKKKRLKKSLIVVEESGRQVFRSALNPTIRQPAINRCPKIEMSSRISQNASTWLTQQMYQG